MFELKLSIIIYYKMILITYQNTRKPFQQHRLG